MAKESPRQVPKDRRRAENSEGLKGRALRRLMP